MTALEEKHFKILIVDENVQFRNNLASRLRIQGFTVEFATGGFHLFHLLERFRDWNLIIFHEDMLDMPAEEMILLIRNSKDKNELPILFISKNNNEKEICDMIFNGANEYVIKSANFQPIVERAQK